MYHNSKWNWSLVGPHRIRRIQNAAGQKPGKFCSLTRALFIRHVVWHALWLLTYTVSLLIQLQWTCIAPANLWLCMHALLHCLVLVLNLCIAAQVACNLLGLECFEFLSTGWIYFFYKKNPVCWTTESGKVDPVHPWGKLWRSSVKVVTAVDLIFSKITCIYDLPI